MTTSSPIETDSPNGCIKAYALIALGANLPSDDHSPSETLEAALSALAAVGLSPVARSRWYRSAAFPPGSGPDFVNGAAHLSCPPDATPETVLAALHEVERGLGRERRERWAPRVCDLDLIAMGDALLPDRATLAHWMAIPPEEARHVLPETLLLPHPRLHERGFVLAPLAEIAADWRHPLTGLSVAEMLAALPEEALEGLAPLE
ncbi:MAG: 2-amino-4-hydroxy-6-hydroxymethyldihydropteridine diphosphokinase [Pseudomonadota bacterium]